MKKKTCKDCGQEKSIDEFYSKRDNEAHAYCKTCHLVRNRKYKYKWAYDITVEEVLSMRKEQDFSCKICGTHEEDLTRGLFVDHCHETGKIRGLLCNDCNTLLGRAKDDIDILKRSIKYLEN